MFSVAIKEYWNESVHRGSKNLYFYKYSLLRISVVKWIQNLITLHCDEFDRKVSAYESGVVGAMNWNGRFQLSLLSRCQISSYALCVLWKVIRNWFVFVSASDIHMTYDSKWYISFDQSNNLFLVKIDFNCVVVFIAWKMF